MVQQLTLESQYSRGKLGGKESLLYFGGRQPGERADSCPKGRLPTDSQWARAFKGEFQGYIAGGSGLHTETAQSALTVILKLLMRWSDPCRLDSFEYSYS